MRSGRSVSDTPNDPVVVEAVDEVAEGLIEFVWRGCAEQIHRYERLSRP